MTKKTGQARLFLFFTAKRNKKGVYTDDKLESTLNAMLNFP